MTLALATAHPAADPAVPTRDVIRALFDSHPGAPCREIRERFLAATGRSLSLRMVQVYSPDGVPRSDPRHLTPGQAATLRALRRAMPAAGNRQLAAAFREATGRSIAERTVRRLAPSSLGPTPRTLPAPVADAAAPSPIPTTPVPTKGFPGLPRDQAGALAWIVRARPDLSPIECVALLAAEMSHQSDPSEASVS